MVAESDRLRYLHVGEAGQDSVRMLFCEIEQCQAQITQQADHVIDGGAHVEADVGSHLVVA